MYGLMDKETFEKEVRELRYRQRRFFRCRVLPAGVVFVDVPVYDSPCVLTDRSTVEVQCGYQTSQNDEGSTLDAPGDAQHAVVACVRGDR